MVSQINPQYLATFTMMAFERDQAQLEVDYNKNLSPAGLADMKKKVADCNTAIDNFDRVVRIMEGIADDEVIDHTSGFVSKVNP